MNFKIRRICSAFLSLILFLSLIPLNAKAQNTFLLTAKPGCKEIVLTWTPVEGAITYQPFLYLPDGTTDPLIKIPTAVFTYTHKDLTDGKSYCYMVKAFDKDAKEIGKTNKVCAKPKCEEEKPVNCDIILKYIIGKKQYIANNIAMQMDSEPEIKEGRTYLVISFVLKHIPGASIDWNNSERKITIKTPIGKIIKLWIGNPKAEVDGLMVDIEPTSPGKGAPYITNGRTNVPMRFVANQLNAKVDWLPATSTIVLTIVDIINCTCTWIEGSISKWTNAPNNQIAIFLDPKCSGTGSPKQYIVSPNLKDTEMGMTLSSYLQKYKEQKFWCGSFCFNKNDQLIQWKASPSKYPNCCNGGCQFTITQKIDLLPQVKELYPGDPYSYQYVINNKSGSTVQFTVKPGENIEKIYPSSFTLLAGKAKLINVPFTLPKDSKPGKSVPFSFQLISDCGTNKTESFSIQSKVI